MMKTINFVMNALDGHSYKRIQEFIDLGYAVKVYGFDRGLSKQYEGIDTTVLATFPNAMSYKNRIKIIYSALKELFRNTHRNDEDYWYYFGLQMAIFGFFLNKNKKYLFEESDMTHLGIKNKFVRNALEVLNKRIIKKSALTVFTSEGFLQYHFGDDADKQRNTVVMPNKIHPDVMKFPMVDKVAAAPNKLRFAFVGFIRYHAVYCMAEFISRNFPQHEFHFYGEIQLSSDAEKFKSLENRENVFFHGFFKNPDKLAEVYSNIDVVVSTYDITSINVLYAEPNKLYESIYFRTPIIVSKGTFLERQVEKYHSGWSVDAFDEAAVCSLVRKIETENETMTTGMNDIPQTIGVDSNQPLAEVISRLNL